MKVTLRRIQYVGSGQKVGRIEKWRLLFWPLLERNTLISTTFKPLARSESFQLTGWFTAPAIELLHKEISLHEARHPQSLPGVLPTASTEAQQGMHFIIQAASIVRVS